MRGFAVAAADVKIQIRGQKQKPVSNFYIVLCSAYFFAITLVIECV